MSNNDKDRTPIALKLGGKLYDLDSDIAGKEHAQIITDIDDDALEIIRHDSAHLLAHAVQELYPNVQITIGPVIEDGFFYDFATDTPFVPEDLPRIEEKMREIAARGYDIVRETWNRDQAIKFFSELGEHYKVELIAAIPQDEPITVYRQGDFSDLCRGPHGPNTKYLKHFKLLKIAGAYWRGDSKNAMLQRIYGTAWATAEQLKDYLYRLEESAKRDHRKLGQQLNLFHFQEEARGMVFWHPKGWLIYSILEQYIRNKLKKHGYLEISTPVLVDRSLWETSGHWEKFGEHMFTCSIHEEELAIKPMNCPCHVQVFKQGTKSYRDLPLRFAEFGMCHRYEPSGALHGLMRVRAFTQDDAHIFCSEEQITSETVAFCKLLLQVYSDFGLQNIKVKFSDRPKVRAGDDHTWDKAEQALKDAVAETGLEYQINSGEGAFYGPKLEFTFTDALKREWQGGTLQVDFILPERLDSYYINSAGNKVRPVMLHRAILGSFERFIGILIEEYEGKFPLWLAPVQVSIATVINEVDPYAQEIYQKLIDHGIRAHLDQSSDKISYKIRQLSQQKTPIIAIIGRNEAEKRTLTLRKLGNQEQSEITVDQLIELINNEVRPYFQ